MLHTCGKCNSQFSQFYHSRASSFLSSFLLKYLPAALITRAPSSSTVGLSQMVKAQILFLVVPPRSDQRLQQQLHSQTLSAFVQFLLPASILANIKFFLLTSKASENRIPAHIKGDYKLFLPSGAFCKKIRALVVLECSTNTDKPAGQRGCSNSAGSLRRDRPSAPGLGETPWHISARHSTGIATKSHPSEGWGNNSPLRWQESSSLNKPQEKYGSFNITCSLHKAVH